MVFYVLDSLVKMGETVGERAEEEDEKKNREGVGRRGRKRGVKRRRGSK